MGIETAGGFLIDRRGRMLLGLRAAHKRVAPLHWDIVGGHVEEGETVQGALAREFREEIAVSPLEHKLIASLAERPDCSTAPVHHVFAVFAWSGEPRNVSDEHVEIRWFTLRQVLLLPNRTPFDYARLHALATAS